MFSKVYHQRFQSSWFCLQLVGFMFAFDFSIVLPSFQEYYLALHGPQELFGLTFGSYDLAGIFASLFFGYLSDKYGERIVTLFAIVTNGVGNLIYALAFPVNHWSLLLVGRILGGMGSAILGTGLSFITLTTPIEERNQAILWYKTAQSAARILGPCLTFLLTFMSDPSSKDSGFPLYVNFFTLGGWFPFLVSLFVFPLAYFKQENSRRSKDGTLDSDVSTIQNYPHHVLPQQDESQIDFSDSQHSETCQQKLPDTNEQPRYFQQTNGFVEVDLPSCVDSIDPHTSKRNSNMNNGNHLNYWNHGDKTKLLESKPSYAVFLFHMLYWNFIQLWGSLFYWAVGANLFAIALANYRLLSSKSDSWKLNIAGIVGFSVGLLWYVTFRKQKHLTIYFLQLGLVAFGLGYLLILPWHENGYSSQPFQFYAAVFFLVMGSAWFFPASNTIYSLFTDHPCFIEYTQAHFGFWINLNTAFGNLGRFLGPTIWAFVITLQDRDSTQPAGCAWRDSKHYDGTNCVLTNEEKLAIPMFSFHFFVVLFTFVVYFRSVYAVKK